VLEIFRTMRPLPTRDVGEGEIITHPIP